MDSDEILCNTVKWQKKKRPDRTVRLGEALSQFMEKNVSPRRRWFEPVAALWDQLLPPELNRHCSLDALSGGQLKVVVDSPVYLHELRLCSPGLLTELQRCRNAHIKKIKLVLGPITTQQQP